MESSVIADIVSDVLKQLGRSEAAPPSPASKPGSANASGSAAPAIISRGPRPGVFASGTEAAEAARAAYEQFRPLGMKARARVIEIVKQLCADRAAEWGRIELEETGIGRLDHKIAKLEAIPGIPGTEWLHPNGISGDRGITMEEHSPFGVIAAIAPVTHSIPTIACNVINMVAAGNAVAVNAHPGGARCAATAVAAFNEAIEADLGIANLVSIVEEPSIESFNELCASVAVNLICVTGGPAVVRAAMKSGKRAICAGPGNPPVVVDSCADLDKAAADIVLGASFDNNLLCIGEKQVFVVADVFDAFLKSMEKAGSRLLQPRELDRLREAAFTESKDAGGCSHPVLNRDLVGADVARLASVAGSTSPPSGTPLLHAVTGFDDLFVQEEQMMPCLPVVRVENMAEGIEKARLSEHGYKHSAMIHTMHVGHMTEMGRALDCTLFVKNGPCVAGLGMGGEGYASFSVATTTGEGITTPLTFTRRRRCVLVDNLNIA